MKFGTLAPLTIVLGLSLAISRLALSREVPTDLRLQHPATSCEQQPNFRVVYEEGEGNIELSGNRLTFRGVGVVEGLSCSRGVLEVTGRGDVADGAAPRLDVSLNDRVLDSLPFTKSRTVRLVLPEGGRISLGYFNDFYKADVRIAVLEEVAFAAASKCGNQFDVEVGESSAGSWLPQDAVAYLVSDPGSVLTPCGSGILSAAVWGKPGANVYPTVEFVQRGRVVATVRTSARRKKVSIELTGDPLTLRIQNPYARLLEDRNLYITGWRFFPAGRP